MLTKDNYEVKDLADTRFMTIENRSDVALGPLAPGAQMKIVVDRDGVPIDRYWRNRVRDAVSDGCVGFVSKQAKVAKQDKEVK